MRLAAPMPLTFKRHCMALLLLGAYASVCSAWAQATVSREASIKAVLILKLIKFVDWPTDVTLAGESMQLCGLGESPVASVMAELNATPVRGKPVRWRKVATLSAAELKGCHVLYLPDLSREGSSNPAMGPRLHGLLTISDAPNFIHRAGMVGLVRQDNKMSFEINLTLAREEGLQPSAQLLDLAAAVE